MTKVEGIKTVQNDLENLHMILLYRCARKVLMVFVNVENKGAYRCLERETQITVL